MSLRHIALRFLLSLCLVANGTGASMAAIHAVPDDGAQALAAAAPGDAAPCHQAAPGATAGDFGAGAQPATTMDCCAQGGCSCACVQPLTAALQAHAQRAQPGGEGIGKPRPGSHGAPALPHLTRPPSG